MLRRRDEVMVLLVAATFLAMVVGITARSHFEGENYYYFLPACCTLLFSASVSRFFKEPDVLSTAVFPIHSSKHPTVRVFDASALPGSLCEHYTVHFPLCISPSYEFILWVFFYTAVPVPLLMVFIESTYPEVQRGELEQDTPCSHYLCCVTNNQAVQQQYVRTY